MVLSIVKVEPVPAVEIAPPAPLETMTTWPGATATFVLEVTPPPAPPLPALVPPPPPPPTTTKSIAVADSGSENAQGVVRLIVRI